MRDDSECMTQAVQVLESVWELEQEILDTKTGIAILDGPSGCGKSVFLRQLVHTKKRILAEDEFCRHIIHHVEEVMAGKNQVFEGVAFDVELLCIEDLDLLEGREQTQRLVAKILNAWAKCQSIIVTGIDLQCRTPELIQGLEGAKYYKIMRL